MKLELRYGRDGLQADLPDHIPVTVFRTGEMPLIDDPRAYARQCLENPIESPPLGRIASGRTDACVVVSDITRPVPNKVLLPPVLETLENAGISPEKIHLLVATGIHRPSTRTELLEMLGESVPARYPVVTHNARDPSCMVRLGYTARGTPIDVNRCYVESKLKIVTGLVEPHFMAGYSGGRKSIAIGLTSVEAIAHLHGTTFLEHPGARNCELRDNPLHAELTEIAAVAGADFSIHAVMDAERRVGGLFCGDLVRAHTAACDFAERHCAVRAPQPYDLVVTTAAGHPLDATYYQAVKGLVGALGILSPGGSIVLAAGCAQGLGGAEFRTVLGRLCHCGDYDEFIDHLARPDNFVIDQWEVEMLVKALRRGVIYLFSGGIEEQDWPLTCATRIRSVEEGVSLALTDGQVTRIAVIPEGPYVVPWSDLLKTL